MQNGAKFELFLKVELNKVLRRQLSLVRSAGRNDNNRKKDKSIWFSKSNSNNNASCFSLVPSYLNVAAPFIECNNISAQLSGVIYYIEAVSRGLIRLLLFLGGIEINPGPSNAGSTCRIVSQNCRGLTDRKKLVRILRSLYPSVNKKVSDITVACLQETHLIDQFTAGLWFKGSIVVDNGERNQRGVCILVPDSMEVCSKATSGIGRWIISVVRSKNDILARKKVIATVYAPNCHRESLIFFQDFFHQLDEATDQLLADGELFDTVITGDFNLVLDYDTGASNRATNRVEQELAMLIRDAMQERELVEPSSFSNGNCFTWRRGTCLSKLDYIFLSRHLSSNISDSSVQWNEHGAHLDHAAVSVNFDESQVTERGRSFPKLFKTDIGSDRDRQWLLDQMIQCESQMPEYWNPHSRLEFMKTMLRSKTLELRAMNRFVDSAVVVREEINSILANLPLSTEDSNKLDSLKQRLAEIEDTAAERLRIRAGVRWREEGERSTSYFLARFKAKSEGAIMHAINLGQRLVKGSKNILAVVQLFYR